MIETKIRRASFLAGIGLMGGMLTLSCGSLGDAVRAQRELGSASELDVTAVDPFEGQTSADDPPAEERFKNIEVLRGLPSSQLYPVMALLSNSLGVTCAYCHSEHFEEEGRREKGIARDMIRMTRAINNMQFQGQPTVTCHNCHNGRPYPNPEPRLSDAGWHELLSPDEFPELPDVSQMYDLHRSAMGGNERIAGLRGSGELRLVGGMDELVTVGFALTATSAGEVEILTDIEYPPAMRVSLEKYRFGRINLAGGYDEPMAVRAETAEGVALVEVMAQAEALVPERLTFELATGLLRRAQGGTSTEMGYVPEEVSFDDYREVGGVLTPHVVRWARGDYLVTLRFETLVAGD